MPNCGEIDENLGLKTGRIEEVRSEMDTVS